VDNKLLNFLFGQSQERDDNDNMLEELQGALKDTLPLVVECKDLAKVLKSIGVTGKVTDDACKFDDATGYKTALELLANNINDLVDAGWVYSPAGDSAMVGSAPDFTIRFVPVTAVDDDSENTDKADLEKIAKEARELGDAPVKGDTLRKEQEKKYDSYVKEGDTTDTALSRLLNDLHGGDPEPAAQSQSGGDTRDWKITTYDKNGGVIDTWEVLSRTEHEAEREVAPDVANAHDWSMMPMEVDASLPQGAGSVREDDETKGKLRTMMSSTGLTGVDVGEGNDRYWATGDVGRTRTVSTDTVKRAVRRLFPDAKYRVNKRGATLHLILWKDEPKAEAATE